MERGEGLFVGASLQVAVTVMAAVFDFPPAIRAASSAAGLAAFRVRDDFWFEGDPMFVPSRLRVGYGVISVKAVQTRCHTNSISCAHPGRSF